MDYDFTLDEYDKPVAEFSSGFEALGRWLTEEVGSDQELTEELLDVIEQLEQKRITSRELYGHDATLRLSRDEVEASSLALEGVYHGELPEDTDLYNDESQASCGLVDFKQAVEAWQQFINDNN
ncbi:MAG: hypothetical protein ACJA0N_001882 [Pseudohongiellaceae bacterium]|jgi:uncharacterized protein YacL (UPF0231 family)